MKKSSLIALVIFIIGIVLGYSNWHSDERRYEVAERELRERVTQQVSFGHDTGYPN